MTATGKDKALGVDVADLVARYAPVGQRHRRRQRAIRLLMVAAVPVTALAVWTGVRNLPSGSPSAQGGNTAGILDLRDQVRAEAAALRAERSQWEARQRDYALQFAALEAKAAELEKSRRALELQQKDFEERRLALNARPSRPAPADDRQAAQKREVTFQSALIDRELKALNGQRSGLAEQQADLERQRRELQDLVDRYDAAVRAGSPSDASTQVKPAEAGPETRTSVDDGGPTGSTAANPLLMAAAEPVQPEMLGTMRGGLRMPGGLDVTFGLTRSASINGVEQFANSIYIDGSAANAHGLATDSAQQAILIQNGPGNVALGDIVSGRYGTVIQNTLDSQLIETKTIVNVSLGNVDGFVNGLGSVGAIAESLSFQQQP